LLFHFLLQCGISNAQVDITYQKPPKEILELADVPQTPSVLIDDDNETLCCYIAVSTKVLWNCRKPKCDWPDCALTR
jgi:hypothetical protein